MAINYKRRENWIRVWWLSIRPFSFTASVMPILLGFLIGFKRLSPLDINGLTVTLCGGVLLHIVANLTNSLYDWKNGFDGPDDPQTIPALLNQNYGTTSVVQMLRILFVFVGILTFLFGRRYGWEMTVWPTLGFLGGYFYTAPPINYKYRGWSLPAVFLFMGLFLPMIAFQVQTGALNVNILPFTIPLAGLVTAILQGNELRDFVIDGARNNRTLTVRYGINLGKTLYTILLLIPYIAVIFLFSSVLANWHVLMAGATLPIALHLLSDLRNNRFTELDVGTAKLHASFGLIYLVSLIFAL